MNQKGSILTIILVIGLLIAGLGGLYYYKFVKNKPQLPFIQPLSTYQPTSAAQNPQSAETLLSETHPTVIAGHIIFFNNGNIYLYNPSGSAEDIVKSGIVTKMVPSPDKESFYYSEDRTDLSEAEGGYPQKYSVYNLVTKKVIHLPLEVEGVKWSLDKSFLLGEVSNFRDWTSNQPMIYNFSNNKLTRIQVPWKVSSGASDDKPTDVRFDQWDFSPDGKKVTYLTNGGSLYQLDVQTGRQTLLGSDKNLRGPLLWSPNNNFLILSKTIIDTTDPFQEELVKLPAEADSLSSTISAGTFDVPGNDAPHPILWSPDGNKLVLYSTNQLFNIKAGKRITPFPLADLRKYDLGGGAGGQDVIWLDNETLITVKDPFGGKGLSEDEKKAALVELNLTQGTIKVLYQTYNKLFTSDHSPFSNQILYGELVASDKENINILDLSTKKVLPLITSATQAVWVK